MKNVAVLMEDGAFALFFSFPTPGDLTAQESPPPGNLPSKAKKSAYVRGQPGDWGGGVAGAAGID